MKTFLAEGDRRLHALVENILDVIAVLSLDGTYVYCSASVFKTLGFTSKELVGKNALGFIHPGDLPRGSKIFGQVLLHPGERIFTQLRYRHKDGSWRWLEGVIFNMLNDPDIRGIVVNFRDVTNRRLEEEKTRQRAEQMTVLYKTTQDLVMERDSHRLLHKIVERAVTLMEVDSGSLYLSEPEQSQVRCVVSYRTRKDYTGMVLKYGEGAAGKVAETGKPLIIDDYPNWEGRARVVDEKDFSALLSVPIIYQKELIGVLHILDDNKTRKFNEADLKVASLFANQAAIAVANARLIEQVQNRSVELERSAKELTHSNVLLASLHSIAAGLTVSRGSEEIISILSSELRRLDIGHGITLYDPETDELVSQYVSVDVGQLDRLEKLLGPIVKELHVGHRVKGIRTSARIPFIAELLENGSARYMSNFLEAVEMSAIPLAIPKALLPQAMKLFMGSSSVPIILLPLKVQERKIGLMAVWGRDLKPEDVDIFIVFVTQVAIALDNSRLLELERQRAIELENRVNERTSQLTALLQEKEILLREVYHRVKNNLQVINSLLGLQMSHLETDSDRQIFVDTRERVKAMALVHEKLYRSGDLARVDFSEYVQGLVENLARAYIQDARDIVIKINVEKVWLGLDTAIPCGLILNELVANSFKHAFSIPKANRKPEVVIELHVEFGGRYILTVVDNGVGIPGNLDWRNTQTMGLQLVTMLMEQLNAEIHLTRNEGTKFAISFSEVKYKERN